MYDTSGSHSVCYASPTDADLAQRLIWLEAEIARDLARRNKPARVSDEWRALRAVKLGRPVATEEAYALFGMLLGLLPPFAIFARILAAFFVDGGLRGRDSGNALLFWGALFLLMNAVCCLVGRHFGAYLGRTNGDVRARPWPAFIFISLLEGVAWGGVTGAAGGAIGFGFGAFFGAACAIPIALLAFPVFAVLHRALSHGGMIEERQLWPLALGIPFNVAVLILSWGIH